MVEDGELMKMIKVIVGVDKVGNHYIMKIMNNGYREKFYINNKGINFNQLPIIFDPKTDKIEFKEKENVLEHYGDKEGNTITVDEYNEKRESFVYSYDGDGDEIFDTNEDKRNFYNFIRKYTPKYKEVEKIFEYEIIEYTFMDVDIPFVDYIPQIIGPGNIDWDRIEKGQSFIYNPTFNEMFEMIMEKEFPGIDYEKKGDRYYHISGEYFSKENIRMKKRYITLDECRNYFNFDYNNLKHDIKKHILKCMHKKIYNFTELMNELRSLSSIVQKLRSSHIKSKIFDKISSIRTRIIEETPIGDEE